jgi:hypothetical protein
VGGVREFVGENMGLLREEVNGMVASILHVGYVIGGVVGL